ncbi:MAG: carboxypeptidase-like regulatory domain-containing protein [Myxococcota bacterium]
MNGTNGVNGVDGVNGINGADGLPGPQGDAGIAIDKATVLGVVFDSRTGGAVADAGVTLRPVGLTARTNQYGEYRFDEVPITIATVEVVTDGLELVGNDIVPSAKVVTGQSEQLPLVAGFTARLNVAVDRLGAMNFDKFHNATKSTTIFKTANCIACHGDRAGKVSRVDTIKEFHGIAPHASAGCTLCHDATIDLVNSSNTVIRKPVNATTKCTVCHVRYPNSFCTATTTPPCP